MEIATPDVEDINNFINDFLSKSYKSIDELVESKIDDVVLNISSYGFKVPMDILNRKSQQVDLNTSDIMKSIKRHLMVYQNKLMLLSKSIEAFDIGRSLKRGFVLVRQNSKFVKRASDFNKKEKAILKFFDGEITTK
jgi:exonuclease VII large subunit